MTSTRTWIYVASLVVPKSLNLISAHTSAQKCIFNLWKGCHSTVYLTSIECVSYSLKETHNHT